MTAFRALVLFLLSGPAMALTFVSQWESEAVTKFGVPCIGAHTLVDLKRLPNQTQFIKVDLDLRDFFEKHPSDHAFIIVDGSLPGPDPIPVPYRGRGIVIFKSAEFYVVSFENFNQSPVVLIPAFTIPADQYSFVVHVNEGGMAAWAFKDMNQIAYAHVVMPANNSENLSLILIGGISGSTPAQIGISKQWMGRFTVP